MTNFPAYMLSPDLARLVPEPEPLPVSGPSRKKPRRVAFTRQQIDEVRAEQAAEDYLGGFHNSETE